MTHGTSERNRTLWSGVAGLFRNRSLRNKIILTFLLVTLLSIGGITYVNNRATSERLTDQAGKSLEELAAARALNIGTMIARNIDALQSFSLGTNVANKVDVQNSIYSDRNDNEWEIRSELRERDLAWQEADEDDALIRGRMENVLAEDLDQFVSTFPGVSELLVTDRYGGLVASSFASPDYYQGDENWWQNTYNRGNGKVFISDPQLHPGGRRVIRVAIPIFAVGSREADAASDSEIIGVIGGLLDTSILADTLSDTHVGQTGVAELMFQSSSYVFGPRDGEYTFYSNSDPGAKSLAALKRAPRGHTQMTLFGHETFVANAPVTSLEEKPYVDALGWQVIVHQDQSEALRVVDETTRNTSLLAAAIAAIVIFVGVIMGQHFARPILTLSEAMTRFTSGELSTRVHIRTGDETGTLGDRFNEMADQMSSLFQKLESRRNELEQRTRQLDANQRAISVIFAASKQSGPDELLGLVVDMIRDQFDLYHVQIYMVDDAGELAVLREGTGYAGRQLMQQGHKIPLDQPALVSRAITQDDPVIVEDVEEAEDFLSNPLLPDTKSELVVPLRLDNQVIGALDVQSNKTNKFNRDMITLFQTMAEQIAFLFENSELLEQVSEQNEALTRFTTQLRTAAELGQRLGTIYEPEELLQETVELIQSRFGFYHAHIYLLKPHKGELAVRAGSGEVGRVLKEREHSIPINADKSLVARAANNKDTILVNDVTLESDFLPNPLLPQTRSEVAVPLIVRGEVLGVLDVQDDQAERFLESDVNALNTLAGQVATALNSARLFEQLQRTLEQTRVRLRANEALNAARTENQVLDAICEQASLYDDVQITLFLVDGDEEDAYFEIYDSRALDSGLTELQSGRRFHIGELVLHDYDFDSTTFTTKNAFEDDRVSEGVLALMRNAGATSIAVIRIQIGDDWFGTLTITSPEERDFEEHRIQLYELLAERGALALREARLRERLTRIGQAIDNTSDAVVISTIDGTAVYSNRAFTELFGYTLQELNESGGAVALHRSEDNARLILGEAMSGGSWSGELEMETRRGDVIPVELRVDAFHDDAGNIVGAIGTITDITERRTLREAGAAVAATLQRDEAIHRILDQLHRVIEHDSASVQLLREGYMEIVGGSGWSYPAEEVIGLRFPIPGDNPNTDVVEQHRPLILNNAEEIGQYAAFGDEPHDHIRSWMGVPLTFRNAVIGMLAMESGDVNAFTPGDAQLVSAFGDHVAIAIENSRLFEQTEQTLARNKAMLDAIPDMMFRFDRDGTYLDVYVPDPDMLIAPIDEVLGRNLSEVLPPPVVESAMVAIERATETGEIQEFEYEIPLGDTTEYFEARIARISDNEVLAIVRDITDQKESEQELRRFTNQLRTAAEITEQFSGVLDPDELLYDVVDLLQSRFDLYHVHMYLLDDDRETLVLQAGSGRVGQKLHEQGHSIPRSREQSIVARAARERSTVHVDDTQAARNFMPNPLLPETRSEVAIPLIGRGRLMGVLDVQDNIPQRFRQTDINTFNTVAGQIAIAIENARLFEQTEEALENLRDSEARNRALLSAVPDMMFRFDRDGTYLDIHSPSEELLVAPREEIIGKNLAAALPPHVVEPAMEAIEQALETGHTQQFEYNIPLDEHIAYFEARIAPNGAHEVLAMVRDITEQKAAQKREQRLTDILEATPDFVSISNAEGRPLYLNEAGREMVELDQDTDISETRIPQYHPEDTHGIIQSALQTAMQEGVWRGENVLLTQSGKRIPLSQVIIAHRSESSDEVDYFSTIARDISDIKEAEESMAQRLQYEEQLAAASQALLSSDDIDESIGEVLGYLRTASGACRVYFFKNIDSPQEEVYARQTHESCAPNVAPQIDNPALQHFSYEELGFADWTEKLSSGDLIAGTIDQFDGSQRKLLENQGVKSVLLLPVLTGNGWYGSIGFDDTRSRREWSPEDIRLLRTAAELIGNAAERAEAQSELARFANQLSTAADISEHINTILDPQQLLPEVVTLLQKRFDLYHVHIYLLDEDDDRLLMESGSGSVGRRLREQGHTIALDDEKSLVARAVRSQMEVMVEDTRDEPAFRHNPLLPDTRSEVALPLITRGEVLGVLDVQDDMPARFSHTDVDALSTVAGQIATALDNARLFEEIQQTAERLREVDRLKSEFLANMSHELRTPLNSIIGYAEIMLMGIDGDLDEETLQDVQAIHENGQHLLELINDILDLAKIEAGRMKLDKEQVQIGALFNEIKTSHLGVLHQQQKDLELEIDVEDELPFVEADYGRLNQILNNLVSNAIKFTDEGRITMRALKDNGWVRVEVEDTGVGISREDQRRIFERFRQVDGSSTRAADGTGLGLAITHHLVEMHGGTIEVDSKLGEGSTFIVHLPAQNESEAGDKHTDV